MRTRTRARRRYPPLTLQSAAEAMRHAWLEYQVAVALGAPKRGQTRRLACYRRLLHVYLTVLRREIGWASQYRAWRITEGAIPVPVPAVGHSE